MQNNKNYRIRTSIDDKVLPVNLNQDIDVLEVLSLKLRARDAYKLHTSNYGILVGRVLANDAFGIPNARVSVFIPISEEDAGNDVQSIYPYAHIVENDGNGVRYNILPDYVDDDCHQDVGTFPNKRRVLDNGTVLEAYDKYYKLTTTTNDAGDYMIYGIPNGLQQIHTDIDLSDIGVLSQRPRDMVYKGYNINEFENPNQFKSSSNLDSLAQIISQNQSVYIYPFWGDETVNEISVSRCDIHVDYKFEPTCVFMGSAVTDNNSGSVSSRCRPNRKGGYNRNLVTMAGTIEMIRKTPGGYVEEYQIQGNNLMDGDGVWCYQIPMNLDYVGTDEYGNIVPTDNPEKGIATRTSVRFRLSIQENGEEGISRHRAKMLIPNNPELKKLENEDGPYPKLDEDIISNSSIYEYGSETPESQFRDLYWNKVYSVKSYIPRIQKRKSPNYDRFVGLKKTNDSNDLNPIPFNTIRGRTPFTYSLLCILATVVVVIVTSVNVVVNALNFALSSTGFLAWIKVPCVRLSEPNDNGEVYAPGCKKGKGTEKLASKMGIQEKKIITNIASAGDYLQASIAEDFDVVNMDFSNDWLNGCVYMPLFHYKGTRKWKLFGIPFTHTSKKRFCSCDRDIKRVKLYESCALEYASNNFGGSWKVTTEEDTRKTARPRIIDTNSYKELNTGIIKEFLNMDDIPVYYYTPGIVKNGFYYQLYATDIILLGSLNECDLDGLPQFFKHLPSTTANVPDFMTDYDDEDDGEEKTIDAPGIDWGHSGDDNDTQFKNGYFTNIKCTNMHSYAKSCINAERMCELGVDLETIREEIISGGKEITINPNGIITLFDIFGADERSMFATLNRNRLIGNRIDERTGYKKYNIDYLYTYSFDGTLKNNKVVKKLAKAKGDECDVNYLRFRFGGDYGRFYKKEKKGYAFPLYDNSFYFYFGLHNGKTAMDVFNRMFFSECKTKGGEKIPGTIKDTKMCSYCVKEGEEDGVIKIDTSRIRKPFEYRLYKNGNNTPEITEEDSEVNELVIEGLGNGNYGIEIEDTNGTVTYIETKLGPNNISLGLETENIGYKYVENDNSNPTKEDREKYNIDGRVVIKNVVIDNEEYLITGYDKRSGKVSLEGNDSNVTISFDFKVQNSLDSGPEYKEDVSGIMASVWKPTEVDINVKLTCDGDIGKEPLETSYNRQIENGINFNAAISMVPVDSLKLSNNEFGIEKRLDEEDSYKFYGVSDINKWDGFVDIIYKTDGNGIETDEVDYDETRKSVMDYKMNAMLAMCNSIYVSNDGGEHCPYITAIGGNNVVYNTIYQDINDVNDNDKIGSMKRSNTQYPEYDSQYPMIYQKTVYERNSNNGVNSTVSYVNNPDFTVTDYWYHFAAFTNGGGQNGQSIPEKSKYKQEQSFTSKIDFGGIKVQNIDRRMNVNMLRYVTPSILNNEEGCLKLTFNNGIRMIYEDVMDNEGNLLYKNAFGEELQWFWADGDEKIITNKENDALKFYSSESNITENLDVKLSKGNIEGKEVEVYECEINNAASKDDGLEIIITSCSYDTEVEYEPEFVENDTYIGDKRVIKIGEGDKLIVEGIWGQQSVEYVNNDYEGDSFNVNGTYTKNDNGVYNVADNDRNLSFKMRPHDYDSSYIAKPKLVAWKNGALYGNDNHMATNVLNNEIINNNQPNLLQQFNRNIPDDRPVLLPYRAHDFTGLEEEKITVTTVNERGEEVTNEVIPVQWFVQNDIPFSPAYKDGYIVTESDISDAIFTAVKDDTETVHNLHDGESSLITPVINITTYNVFAILLQRREGDDWKAPQKLSIDYSNVIDFRPINVTVQDGYAEITGDNILITKTTEEAMYEETNGSKAYADVELTDNSVKIKHSSIKTSSRFNIYLRVECGLTYKIVVENA